MVTTAATIAVEATAAATRPNRQHAARHQLEYPDHGCKRGAVCRARQARDQSAGGGKCKYVYVNQESARATDGVRLWYDYNRDGWVIEQASTFQWADDDKVLDHDWREVAFVKS